MACTKSKGLIGVVSCLALPAFGGQLVEAAVGAELLFGLVVTTTTNLCEYPEKSLTLARQH